MIELPICRWRGQPCGNDCYPCFSTQLVIVHGVVTAKDCLSCPVQNHEIPTKSPIPERNQKAPQQPRTIWRFIGQVLSYAEAKAKWVLAGSPVTPPEALAERKAICEACPNFNREKYGCGVCGCGQDGGSLDEKQRMATESCPADPPRWVAIGLPVVRVSE